MQDQSGQRNSGASCILLQNSTALVSSSLHHSFVTIQKVLRGLASLVLSMAIYKRSNYFMLYTIAVILLILWALGMLSSYTLGGFIHLLLVIAIIMVLIRIIRGQ